MEVPKALYWGLSGGRGCGALGIPLLASDFFSPKGNVFFVVVVVVVDYT